MWKSVKKITKLEPIENEIENIGLLEIINQDSTAFIEWPKKIHNFLPKKSVNIKIELQNNVRKISIVI